MKLHPHPWGLTPALILAALPVMTYAGLAVPFNPLPRWIVGGVFMAVAVHNDERIHGEYFLSLSLMALLVLFSGMTAIVTGLFPTLVFGTLALTTTVYAVFRVYTRPENANER